MSSMTSPSALLGELLPPSTEEAERLEVGGEVVCAVASAELDDADGLAGGGGAGGKSVELADLDGRIGDVGDVRLGGTKMGHRLWAVVEAEYGEDVRLKLLGDRDDAFADAEGAGRRGLHGERDAEGLLHGGRAAGEVERAAAGLGARHGEAEVFGEGAEDAEGFGVGSVTAGEDRAGEALRRAATLHAERSFGRDDDGDRDGAHAPRGLRGCGCCRCSDCERGVGGDGLALAARQGHTALRCETRC
jgi:hypothetical protein